MKKLVLLIVIIACVLVLGTKPGYAASELEVWCLAEGQTWEPVSSTCTVTGPVVLDSAPMLTVLAGETIYIASRYITSYIAINNQGIINNDSFINNYSDGIINNHGFINNYGTINNYSDGIINSYGTFNNHGVINNWSSYGTFNNNGYLFNNQNIFNHGTIDNTGTFKNKNNGGVVENYGTINNYCSGIYMGALPIVNPIVDYLCAYLPFIKR